MGEPFPPPPPREPLQERALPARPEVTRDDLRRLVESTFGAAKKGRWARDDQWEGLCPVHDDHSPSFGAGIRENRKDPGEYVVLLSCKVCGDGRGFTESACGAVGIDPADLFSYTPSLKHRKLARRPSGNEPIEVYDYTDEAGALLFQVLRWSKPGGKKTFSRRRPDPANPTRWINDTEGVRRVLYNLPAIRANVMAGKQLPVWYCEGEKDANALIRLGQVATTHSSGAGQWREDYGPQLEGVERLIVVEDNDKPGRDGAAKVVEGARRAGVKRVVRLDLRDGWPDVPPDGGDVFDVLDAFGSIEGLEKLLLWAEDAEKPREIVRADAELVDPAASKRASALKEGETWEDLLEVEPSRGVLKVVSCPYNASLILESHPFFAGRIRYDEFLNKIRFNPPDWWRPAGGDRLWRPTDVHFFRQWCNKYLRKTIILKGEEIVGPGALFEKELVRDSAMYVADGNRCHVLREWLSSLVWDKHPRLHAWLVKYCNADFGRYAEAVGTAWMVSAVARAFEPGCQADHMLVLRGGQGARKSGLFRLLAGEYYGSMMGVDLSKRDSKLHLLGKWILEFAELETLNKHDTSVVKAYLTEVSDDFRKPYAAEEEAFPRQCVFCGTINERAFLKDDTGNRRFWVVECGDADLNMVGLAEVRDQLWAEAVARYRLYVEARARDDQKEKEKYQWWLTKEDEALAREVQKANMAVGDYDEKIADWLEDEGRGPGSYLLEGTPYKDQVHVTVAQIVEFVLKREPRPGDEKMVAGAMARLGWTKDRFRPPGSKRTANPRWYWHPGPYDSVQETLVEIEDQVNEDPKS